MKKPKEQLSQTKGQKSAEAQRHGALVDAWLANKSLEHLQRYMKGGRRLERAGTDDLKAQWVAAMALWASSADLRESDAHCETRQDVEAELHLRGEQLPKNAAKPSIEALQRGILDSVSQARTDPNFLDRVSELSNEIEEFERSSKRSRQ